MHRFTIQNLIRLLIFATGECSERTCLQESRGTSEMAQNIMKSEFGSLEDGGCICQCVHHLPVFREDLRLCVHDIHGNVVSKMYCS